MDAWSSVNASLGVCFCFVPHKCSWHITVCTVINFRLHADVPVGPRRHEQFTKCTSQGKKFSSCHYRHSWGFEDNYSKPVNALRENQCGLLWLKWLMQDKWRCWSPGFYSSAAYRSVFSLSCEIYQYQLDRPHIFMFPRGWILMTLVISWLCIQHHREVDIYGFEGNVQITVGWISMKFSTHIHVPLEMNFNKVGDPLTFHLVPSSGQNPIYPMLWFTCKNSYFPIILCVYC